MTNIEIIFLVIALGFIALVIVLTIISIAVCKTLKNVSQTIISLQKQIDDLNHAPRTLIDNAINITESINYKMQCLDPLFRSFADLGERLECCTAKFKGRQFERCEESKLENITDIVELALKGINLFYKFKNRS